MKLWLDDDDTRIVPEGYKHVHSVNEAKLAILNCILTNEPIEVLDLDNDLGDFAYDGGDGHKLLDWLVETKRFFPVKLHTMNPVERQYMQTTINRYWPSK